MSTSQNPTRRLAAAYRRAPDRAEFARRLARDVKRHALVPAVLPVERSIGARARTGSSWWLKFKEQQYGGFVTSVTAKASPDHYQTERRFAGHTGGDRMSSAHNNYAAAYAKHLSRRDRDDALVIVEVGILKGTGLAIWCDLFPRATVIGLDIDLQNTCDNMTNMRELGAFSQNAPSLLEFDAYRPDTTELRNVLAGRKIDVVIDDGPHTLESIEATAAALKPLLAEKYTYFVEDNPRSHGRVAAALSRPVSAVVRRGRLPVIDVLS